MRILAVALIACSVGLGQTPRYPCEPTPEVAAAIRRLEDLRRTEEHNLFVDQARELMAGVVDKYPRDIFANTRYLYLFRERGHDDLIARYRSAMDAHPDDPRYALFYATSLIGTDTPEALRRLTALTAEPDFPHPYLLIGEIHSHPAFNDHDALSRNLIRFVEACPAYLPAYELLAFAGRGEELGPVTEKLRRLLSGRTDRDALVAYRWLWPMEFRVVPVSEHGALRERVDQDLAFLRSKHSVDDPEAVETFRRGHRAAGNTAAKNLLPRRPSRRSPIYDVANRWYREHRLEQGSSEEQVESYHREWAEAATSWIAQWPDEPLPYLDRFRAVATLSKSTEEDVVAAGAQLIEINRKRPRRFLTTPAIIAVARAYVERGMRLDEVPGMVATGLREAELKHIPESDLSDGRNQRLSEEFRFQARIEARAVEFDWSLKTSNLPRARNALTSMRRDIDQLFAVTTQPRHAQYLDSSYWKKMAELADVEGRTDDAEQFRHTAEERRSVPSPSRTSDSSVSATGRRLPPFGATGIDGRVWTAADLDGKVAVMNLWATWCAPCIEELPYLQQLHDRLKDQPDVVVLALNVDRNPGVVAPFLKGRGYTFPVLLAQEYVERFLPEMGIPRNWVVKSGVIRSEQVGFSNRDHWLDEMLAEVEEAQGRER